MNPLVFTINQALAIFAVIGQIIIAVLLLGFLFFPGKNRLADFVSKRVLLFSFIVALIATGGSLFYSEIAGFEPCKLCWFQRIFMYPQVVLLGIALWLKDRTVFKYSLSLAVPGALVAAYHYLLQSGIIPPVKGVSCDALGFSAACSQSFFMTFGYITIPMMALTAFLLIILFLFTNKITKRQSAPPVKKQEKRKVF